MARSLDPKCKQCRREGVKLFLKADKCFSPSCPLIKRNYAPGAHGAGKTFRRMSPYGRQLREKQKAKRTYRLLERQFKNYYLKALKQTGDTSENFLRFLETRLDNIVFRLGLAVSRDASRQLVNHGHVMVNGKKITIPSYQVKVGEAISIKKSSLASPTIQENLANIKKVEVPGWLNLDLEKVSGQMVTPPKKDQLSLLFDPAQIIEFYSR